MKPTLHPVILGESLAFEELLSLASDLGYEGVEGGFGAVSELGPEGFVGLTEEYGVELAVWPMGVQWREDEETFQRGLSELGAQAQLAAEIDCMRTCTWVPPAVDSGAEETRRTWMRRWGEIARIVGEYGHRFGLEWVAPYHARADREPIVWRMDDLLEMEEEIGEPNLGVLVDSFHWFNADHDEDDLRAVPVEKVVHVHINDAPDRPLKEQLDYERLVPGEGIINLEGFVSALADIGYEDYVSIEVFSEELKGLAPAEAAARAKRGYDAVMSGVGA